MSDKVKISLSYSGIGQMLKGPEMQSLVAEYGADMALSAGDGYSYSTHNTGQRQACNIFPTTRKAARDNMKNNTLLKLL